MSLRDLHADWAWVVVVGNAAAGSWALAAHLWEVARVRALWWFVAAAQLAVLVQVGLGFALLARGSVLSNDFHLLYGVAAALAVGVIYGYRRQIAPWRHLLYGFGGLFLMGLGIRAMTVGV